MNSLLALLPLLAAAQGPVAPQERALDERDGWVVLNGVALQSGDRIITLGELDRQVETFATERNIPRTDPSYGLLAQNVVRQLRQADFEPQAGEDLGLDPQQIQMIARRSQEDERRKVGTSSYLDQLQEQGLSVVDKAEQEEDKLYREIWQLKQIGGQFFDTRPTEDLWIRPGELEAIYRSNREMIEPDFVTLQVILARPDVFGGEELGFEFLEEVRLRALEGADFSALVEEYSELGKENQGFQRRIPVFGIAFPELKAFAEEARTGDIGPVMLIEFQGQPYLMIPRIDVKEEGRIPPYDDRDIQQQLRSSFRSERNNRLLGSARKQLVDNGYSWVTPRLSAVLDPPTGPRVTGPRQPRP